MPRKYKLHCFWCGALFKSKNEVWRSLFNEPLCEYCFSEHFEDETYIEDGEGTVAEIETKYNRSLNKWWNHNHLEKCPRCEEMTWTQNDQPFYCYFCAYPDPD